MSSTARACDAALQGHAFGFGGQVRQTREEIGRFGEAFANQVLAEETRRFLNDDRHHLMLGYVGDLPGV